MLRKAFVLKPIIIVLLLTLLYGCQSKKVFLPPITEGNWYRPHLNTSWQWQLRGEVNTDYDADIYDIDLFDADKNMIKGLHAQGKKVICYFSAGSYENWREDKSAFPVSLLGNRLDGWENENWLDIRSEKLIPIMKNRLALAVSKGCDGVEPDNIDGYNNNTGFALDESDQLYYNQFLANEAHRYGLAVALKNDIEQITLLEPYFDFAINEQCYQYDECDALQAFIKNKKPVFHAEYHNDYINNTDKKQEQLCEASLRAGFNTLILPLELDDSFRITCD